MTTFKKILVLDPGESTGWVLTFGGEVLGGTCGKDHKAVMELITRYMPDIIVFERFNLYPGMAKSLAWNTFYACEVIGVIKFGAMVHQTPYVEQAPSVKKYAGNLPSNWKKDIQARQPITEHTKDAYKHLLYYLKHSGKDV